MAEEKKRVIIPVIACVVVLGIVLAVVISNAVKNHRYQEEYDRGMRYLAEGNYSEAKSAFGRLSGIYLFHGERIHYKDADEQFGAVYLKEAEENRAEGKLDSALRTLAYLLDESDKQEYKDVFIEYRNEYCVEKFNKKFQKYASIGEAISDLTVKEIRYYTLYGDEYHYPVFTSSEFEALSDSDKLIAMELLHEMEIPIYTLAVESLCLFASVIETSKGLYEYSHEGSPVVSQLSLNGEVVYALALADSPTREEYANSNGTTRKKCLLCNGTGHVRYYYGSSDLEAWLSGHDSYTIGPCTMCKGTGYVDE